MAQHEVRIPPSEGGSYSVSIGSDLLESVWARIESDWPGRRLFVVTDENVVAAGHLQRLIPSEEAPSYVISPAGEKSKTVDKTVEIIEAMEKAALGRDCVVVALGGGTVGDMAGFAAAVFKRGVPIVQIPTTSLAQADSAIGGKTGVDSSISKNAFGAFWHPSAVYVDVSTLTTLDDRQYRAGLVESVKHGLIADREYFEYIETNIDAVLERRGDVLEKIALANCSIKGGVVEADPQERNQRRMLNYGHTIGHAVESASHFELLHGEAVSVGIIAAGLIESAMGLADDARLDRIGRLLEQLAVPTSLSDDIDRDVVIDLLKHDKKAVNAWPRFVLLDSIGRVHTDGGQYAVEVSTEIVRQVLKEL